MANGMVFTESFCFPRGGMILLLCTLPFELLLKKARTERSPFVCCLPADSLSTHQDVHS